MHELDELRTHLTRSQEEEHAMRFRMSQLEQLLDMIRHETARERTFLIEQQDLFLIEIMTDHERQIDELHDRLREANQAPSRRRESSDELIAQRDQAREYATRCERERDLAWQELADAAAPTPVKAEQHPTQPVGRSRHWLDQPTNGVRARRNRRAGYGALVGTADDGLLLVG